jgi:uncharacterized membrane protein
MKHPADPVAKNIKTIARLELAQSASRSLFARACDRVTVEAGTTRSIAFHALWFGGWIVFNSTSARAFDKFPFPLLTMIVSLEAIFLTLFVLASQNRMTHEADKRTNLDLQINLLAEQEMTLLLHMVRDLCVHFKVNTVSGSKAVEGFLADTNIQHVFEQVERDLPSSS